MEEEETAVLGLEFVEHVAQFGPIRRRRDEFVLFQVAYDEPHIIGYRSRRDDGAHKRIGTALTHWMTGVCDSRHQFFVASFPHIVSLPPFS
jgi:hypothetical protein